MSNNDEMMAACGLLCGSCEIRRMPFDEEAAKTTINWYRNMGWLKEDEGLTEALEKKMFCKGCHDDRMTHWSPDCWILKCCVDEKHLRYCHECNDFPCNRLNEWATQNDGYRNALERLKRLRTTA